MGKWEQSLLELIRRASCELTQDVLTAISKAAKAEDAQSSAAAALDLVWESVAIAKKTGAPLLADPVIPHFYVTTPPQFDALAFRKAAEEAIAAATKAGYLQPELEDLVSGRGAKSNVGEGSPFLHFHAEERKNVEVRVVLDTGVAHGPGAHYTLPDEAIGAARDLNGVRRAALHALVRAHGSGIGPGVLAIGIGGDRASGHALAHQQFLRPLGEKSRVKALAQLEARILEDANSLGIGPMGFGGKNVLLGVKIASQLSSISHAHVSICYLGWAMRRHGAALDAKGAIADWLYELPREKQPPVKSAAKKPAPAPVASTETPAETAKKAAKKTSKAATKTTKDAAPKAAKTKKAPAKATKKKTTTKKTAKPAAKSTAARKKKS
ncbi:MAG: fumarate hydratase [Planctomycetota bacterium]